MNPSRRALIQGCAAIALATLSEPAWALPAPVRAPRRTCHHTGCRHHRPDGDTSGLCGLSLRGPAVLQNEETL